MTVAPMMPTVSSRLEVLPPNGVAVPEAEPAGTTAVADGGDDRADRRGLNDGSLGGSSLPTPAARPASLSCWLVVLGRHRREGDGAAVAGCVDGAEAELHVVLRDVERDGGHVADVDGVGPVGRGGLPGHYLILGQVRFGVGVPGESCQVGAGEAGGRCGVDLQV